MTVQWVVAFLLLAAPSSAEYVHGVLAHQVTDKNKTAVLDELCRRGNIRVRVRLYHSASVPTRAFIARSTDPFLHAAIVVDDETLKWFSRQALAGLLAHELGHLAYGHVTDGDWGVQDDRGRKIRQHQADAFAIRVAGRDAFYVYLRTNGAPADCMRYIDYIDAALNQHTIEYDPDNAP